MNCSICEDTIKKEKSINIIDFKNKKVLYSFCKFCFVNHIDRALIIIKAYHDEDLAEEPF